MNKTNASQKGGKDAEQTVSPAIAEGRRICNIFFGAVDTRRNKVAYMYASNCRLLFNGNTYNGFDQINDFWVNKMPTTSHTIQNIAVNLSPVVNLLICASNGTMEMNEKEYFFNQTLTLVREDDMWKIVSDNYRYFDL